VDGQARNEVALVGRVAAPAEERTLPSGDVLLLWRLVVDRPPPRRPVPDGVRVPVVDTLDCVAWTGPLRRVARTFEAGDVVSVEGALRRRFWRAGAGAASRCEVEVVAARRLRRGQVSR
jgi:single-strand DNA-binding protein